MNKRMFWPGFIIATLLIFVFVVLQYDTDSGFAPNAESAESTPIYIAGFVAWLITIFALAILCESPDKDN